MGYAQHNETGAGTLLVATGNPGKAREYRHLLGKVPYRVASLGELGIAQEVEETGSSFEENALIKARAYCSLSGLLTLADDSGLEVDCLGGAPGVMSARYGGPGATDGDRVRLLLKRLLDIPWGDRTARFRCVIALVSPSGAVETATGAVEGYIGYEPRGSDGFGYDPVFYIPRLGKTVAELSLEEKNTISHRSQAARKAVAFLDKAEHNGCAGG